jgi:hypothetical protein
MTKHFFLNVIYGFFDFQSILSFCKFFIFHGIFSVRLLTLETKLLAGADWPLWQCGDCREAFKGIFREYEAFDYKCEAFIKTTRLFEDIFREMEASIRNLTLF